MRSISDMFLGAVGGVLVGCWWGVEIKGYTHLSGGVRNALGMDDCRFSARTEDAVKSLVELRISSDRDA